ncbi:MAG: hypothetical protein Q8O95_00010 [bacterium]|nr:hypothetical protein [bacterium]
MKKLTTLLLAALLGCSSGGGGGGGGGNNPPTPPPDGIASVQAILGSNGVDILLVVEEVASSPADLSWVELELVEARKGGTVVASNLLSDFDPQGVAFSTFPVSTLDTVFVMTLDIRVRKGASGPWTDLGGGSTALPSVTLTVDGTQSSASLFLKSTP